MITRIALAAIAALLPFGAATAPASDSQEHPGAALFARHCAVCHTIGGGAAMGPDLAGITDRREDIWLLRWIQGPAGMAEADPEAADLVQRWGGWVMPTLDLTPADRINLVDFLAAADAGELAEDLAASASRPTGGRRCGMRGGMRRPRSRQPINR